MRPVALRKVHCAIYTRVSTDQGLEQEFNSLDAQREASEAYIKSQAHEGWVCLPDPYDDGGFSGGSMDRPALQRLLDAVRSRKVDVIVVYKVDRLTRSLADFAKLVELFDAHGVSFVSVTQAFNTTTSMGRLTLNVLLSFAQFEREVTGERIRDKIAASKKKGLWMGGIVPYGYRVNNRRLVVDENEAPTVRQIFERYLALGSIPALIEDLHSKSIRTRVRRLGSGRQVGGIPFSTGPLHHLLNNRIYLGEINHKERSYPGEHEAIITPELFAAVQQHLNLKRSNRVRAYDRSEALLVRLIFDDRGHRMTPVYACKNGIRYRYYQSWILAQRRRAEAGSICRIPAEDVERVVSDATCAYLARHHPSENRSSSHEAVRTHVEKIVVHGNRLEVSLRRISVGTDPASESDSQTPALLTVPWSKPSAVRHREILGGAQASRPMRSEARDRLIIGIARSRRWLEQIASGKTAIPSIAQRYNLSEKTVRSTISLAFLAPDIVQAAFEGRLPRGLGISQMTDLPMDWSIQRRQLGLA